MKLILIGIIAIGLLIVTGVFVNVVSFFSDDCLRYIAEDYCEDNGLYFSGISFPNGFVCREDERSMDFKFYRFLEDEIEECEDRR